MAPFKILICNKSSVDFLAHRVVLINCNRILVQALHCFYVSLQKALPTKALEHGGPLKLVVDVVQHQHLVVIGDLVRALLEIAIIDTLLITIPFSQQLEAHTS